MKCKRLIVQIIIAFWGIFSSHVIYCQNTLRPSSDIYDIASPEVRDLSHGINDNVNLYRGQASINVPIHSVATRSFNLPISLNYQAKAIKPNTQIGWIGANWTLEAGGSIRLNPRGMYDRYRNYYPLDPSQTYDIDMIFDETQFNTVYGSNQDIARDAFSFNFNGYSGSIYFDQSNNIVCTNPELKVEIGNAAFTHELLQNDVGELFGTQAKTFKITTGDGTMYFFGNQAIDQLVIDPGNKVTVAWHLYRIITPSHEHISFNYEFNESTNSNVVFGHTVYYHNLLYVPTGQVTLSDWTKIMDGSVFNVYEHSNWDYVLSIDHSLLSDPAFNDLVHLDDPRVNVIYDFFQFNNQITPVESRIIYCNIKTIKTAFEVVEFNKSSTDSFEEIDPLEECDYVDDLDPEYKEALGEIIIYPSDNDPNDFTKKYELGYNAFALTSITEIGSEGGTKNPFLFDYYTGSLGALNSLTNNVDHWGFYNAFNIYHPNNISSIIPKYDNNYMSREPLGILFPNNTDLLNYLNIGMLEKITYPTKGHKTFEYEAHDYGFIVNRHYGLNSNNSVYEMNPLRMPAGGLRIKKISETSGEVNSTTKSREFFYEKDYLVEINAGINSHEINSTSLRSSGILNSVTNYFRRIGNSADLKFDFIADSKMLSSNDYISYSEVTEVINGTQLITHTFTDHTSNPDSNPEKSCHFATYRDAFHTMGRYSMVSSNTVSKEQSQISMEHERGKPLNTKFYKYDGSNFSLLTENEFFYRDDPERLNNCVEVIETEVLFTNSDKFNANGYNPDAGMISVNWGDDFNYELYQYEIMFTDDNQIVNIPKYEQNNLVMIEKNLSYYYDYHLSEKTEKTYIGQDYSNYTKTQIGYTYDEKGQLQYIDEINSDGSVVTTEFIYPDNLSSDPVEQEMFSKNMIAKPIEKNISRSGKALEKTAIEYLEVNPALPKQYKIFSTTDGENGQYEIDFTYDKYSTKGNPLQFTSREGVTNSILWNSGGNIGDDDPLEIVNMDFGEYSYIIGAFSNGCAMVQSVPNERYKKLWLNYDTRTEPIDNCPYCKPSWMPNWWKWDKDKCTCELAYCHQNSYYDKTFIIGSFVSLSEEDVEATLTAKFKMFEDGYGGYLCPESFTVQVGFYDESIQGLALCPNCVNGNGTIERPVITNVSPNDIQVSRTEPNILNTWQTRSVDLTLEADKYYYFIIEFDVNTSQSQMATYILLDEIKLMRKNLPEPVEDFNGDHIIAQVKNAHWDETFVNTYEYETDFPDVNMISNSVYHTGLQSIKLLSGENNRTRDINIADLQGEKYIYSAWIKTNGIGTNLVLKNYTTPDAVPEISTAIPNTHGNWELFECEVDLSDPGFSSATVLRAEIKNSGTTAAYVDDERFGPSDAMFTSYTYLPSVGVSSITDSNNRTITYSYDDLGRLITIRNHDGHIIEEYVYHLAQ